MARKPVDRTDFAILHTETLPDGRTKFTFSNGAVSYSAPVPGEEWLLKTANEICQIQYGMQIKRMKEGTAV
jgi:hypothetical protein